MLVVQLIIVQVIIFAVVLFFIKKMLYGDTETAVNRLDNSFKQSEQKKQKLAELIKEMEDEYKQKKIDAERIASEIKDQAEQEIFKKRGEVLKKAKDEAERIVADTQEASEKFREQVKKEEQDNMYIKCADLLAAVMKDTLKEEFDKAMLNDFLKDFEALDVSHIPDGLESVELVFAKDVSGDIKNKIKTAVQSKVKSSTGISESVDENIISGVIIKFGTLVLDGSLASKLNEKLQEKVQ